MKIKKVNIKAFRLFNDVSVNLTARKDSNKAANFVAIYAPNGFGKTSFFDAMEFCMTKSIQRVKSNFKENFTIDQKHGASTFIHNKDFPNESIDIKMTFEDCQEVWTICKPADECSMLKSNHIENGYFRDAILSQDWLSEFLSSKSSAERFKIFVQNFDETRSLLDYYQSLGEASRGIKRNIDNISKDLKQISKNIDKSIDANVMDLLKEIVEKLKAKNIDVRKISSDMNACPSMKVEAGSIYSSLLEDEKKVDYIISNLDKMQFGDNRVLKIDDIPEWIEKQKSLKSAIDSIAVELTKIEHLKDLKHQVGQYENSLENSLKTLDTFIFLIDQNNKFQTILNKIVVAKKEKQGFIQNKAKNEAEIANIKQAIAQLYEEIAKLQSNKEQNDKKLLSLHESYKEYLALSIQHKANADSVLLNQKRLNTVDESISKLEQRHSALLRFVTGLRKKEFIVIPNLYEEETRKLFEIKGKIDSANKALIDIENKVEEESRLNDILQNLLVSSQSIVEHIKGSKCPLCGFDYEQHENLLVAISENTVLSSSLKEDIEKRNRARKDVEDIEHGLRNRLSKLTDEVEENINKTVEEIAKVKKDRENINNQLKQSLSDKTKNEATFTKRFSDFKDCTEDEVRNKYKNANQNINCELNNIKSRLGHNKTDLAKLIGAIDKLYDDIKKCDKTIAQLNADTFYTQYLHTAGTDNVLQYKLDDWKKQKDEVLAETVKWKKEIDDANAEISKLKKEGVEEAKVISLQQRQISFSSEYTKVKEKLTETYNFLKTKCLMESISLPMDSEQINTVYQEAIRKSHERRSDLNDKLEVVKEYIRIIGIVGKYSENENFKKQYDVLEIKRQKDIKNKEIVDQEKTRLEKYLKDFVNGFFKLDIINKLYNTIDPHPEYKKISFECDFSLKDPRLNVLMYSEKEGRDSIVPNLYFSTAQINILSFCIFMAKALFAKTDKKEDLGCIFIDDPVQALDDINILSMIDLLRNVAFSLDKQIVITTHDKDFFELMKMKVPERLFNSRFIEFKGRGIIE